MENGEVVEISNNDALEIAVERAEEEIKDLLNEAIELHKEINGGKSPFELEKGLKVAEMKIKKSSHSSFIYNLNKAIERDRCRHVSQMLILAQTKGYDHVVSGLENALRG